MLDPSTDFHALWRKRRGLAQGCAFWGFANMAPHLGGQTPKLPIDIDMQLMLLWLTLPFYDFLWFSIYRR